MKEKEMIRDFTSGNITKQLLRFATPLFLANLLQIVYNLVDMVVVGNVLGEIGISAVSVGGDITNFLTFLVMGFSNAGQIIISQFIGAGQKKKVGTLIGTMSTFLFAVAVIISALSLLLRGNILDWMNTPSLARADAMDYSVTCMAGLVFIYGYNAVSAVLRGMGDSKRPFFFIAVAALINIALDIIFVQFCGMRAFGAALATVISQAISFICALVYLFKKREQLGFEIDRSCFRIDREMLGILSRLGIPMAIKSTSIQFSKLFVNSYINSYSVTVSAVAGIGHKLNTISNLISNSTNTASSSMVGQNIGAERYDRVSRIMLSAFFINAVAAAAMIAALVIFPEEIFMLFNSDSASGSTAEFMRVAMEFVPVAVLIFVASAFRCPMNALVNGSGNVTVNFTVALLDGIVVRIGMALLLGLVLNMGYIGFWYGDVAAAFTPFVVGGIYYISGKWKTRKYVVKA